MYLTFIEIQVKVHDWRFYPECPSQNIIYIYIYTYNLWLSADLLLNLFVYTTHFLLCNDLLLRKFIALLFIDFLLALCEISLQKYLSLSFNYILSVYAGFEGDCLSKKIQPAVNWEKQVSLSWVVEFLVVKLKQCTEMWYHWGKLQKQNANINFLWVCNVEALLLTTKIDFVRGGTVVQWLALPPTPQNIEVLLLMTHCFSCKTKLEFENERDSHSVLRVGCCDLTPYK